MLGDVVGELSDSGEALGVNQFAEHQGLGASGLETACEYLERQQVVGAEGLQRCSGSADEESALRSVVRAEEGNGADAGEVQALKVITRGEPGAEVEIQ